MNNRILIVSASTGQGHNQVAYALNQELSLKGYKVNTIEPLKEVSKSLDTLVSDGYKILATLMPKMFGGLYKVSNKQEINKSVAKLTIKALEEKVGAIIDRENPGLIISTHPLLVKVVGHIKNKKKLNVPFVSIVTDYLPHSFYISEGVDAYIVGSVYTKACVIDKGIDPEKVYVYGIPIKRIFHESHCDSVHKKSFTILIMGGSMGLSSIKKALKYVLRLNRPIKVVVVCGNNKQLRKAIENKYESAIHSKTLEVLGFTDQIPILMEHSDVIITKPGGLTVTESLAKKIPMIIPYYIPGQEKENAEVLENAGAAVVIDKIKELNEVIIELMENPIKLYQMKKNMAYIAENHSLDSVLELCDNLICNYNKMEGVHHG